MWKFGRILPGTISHKNEEKNPATKSAQKSAAPPQKKRKSVLPKTDANFRLYLFLRRQYPETETVIFRKIFPKYCKTPGLLQEPLGPFGPEVSRSVVGVSLGSFGPRAPECPKSVPRVCPERQKGAPDAPGTLSGHFLDTPEPEAQRAPKTPRGTLPGHFLPKGPERLFRALWEESEPPTNPTADFCFLLLS